MTGWRQALQADLSGLLAQDRGAARAYRDAAEKAALQEWADSEGIEGDMTTICGHPKVSETSQSVKSQAPSQL